MFSLKMNRHAEGKTWKRWWLFNAKDFESLMYPCFIFCRILGIFPYKLKASTFEASKPHYILSSVISCVNCAYNLIFIYNTINNKISGELITTMTLFVISYFMLNSFIVIITLILSGARMRLLQIILKTSLKLPPESYRKMSKFIHVKDILIIILRIVSIYIYFRKMEFDENYYFILNCIFIPHSALMEVQINILHINCVCVLKACFERINDSLTHMQKFITNNVKRHDSRLIYHVWKNKCLLTKLKNLMKWHLMISDAVQMLNIIFSPQLFVSVIMTFSTITFELYFYTVSWQNRAIFSLDRHFLDVLSISMIYNVIKITLLVWACETGKNRAQKINTTIHDLLNSTNDEQIKKEVKM